MKLKPRPQYLSKLVAAQDNSLIKVITGMRRCGKSSLLTLFRQHLLQQGIAEDHIIMMNLESFQYSSFTFEDLHNAIADRMQQDDHYYLLLDEVQLVDKWERAVNALHTDADVDITITGSNAYLLSSQLATLLSGRYMEINVMPAGTQLRFRTSPARMAEARVRPGGDRHLRCDGRRDEILAFAWRRRLPR